MTLHNHPYPAEGVGRFSVGDEVAYTVADLGGFQRFPLKPPLANNIIEIH